jgi:N-acetylmuramoyl-L-alanine amidase
MRRRDLFALATAALATGAGAQAARAGAPLPRPRPAASAAAPLVVLDAGHGGRDPGAVGAAGTLEKDVVLDVVLGVAERLRARPGVRVGLTRSDDRFLPLARRREIARERGAALFLSIHADSAPNPQARGLSAYTLSDDASDDLARALADRENRADRFAGAEDVAPRIAAMLNDFLVHETLNRSIRAKGAIVEGAGRSLPLLDNPKRSAGFAVLRAPDVPSVLIETGFLSNPRDERRLADARERARIADVLAREIGEVATAPPFA